MVKWCQEILFIRIIHEKDDDPKRISRSKSGIFDNDSTEAPKTFKGLKG